MLEPSSFSDKQLTPPLKLSTSQRKALRELECNRCALNGNCTFKQSLLDYERLKSIMLECWVFHTTATHYPFGLHMFRPVPTNEIVIISPNANLKITNHRALSKGPFLTDTPKIDGVRPQMISDVVNSFHHVFDSQLDIIEGTMAQRNIKQISPRYQPLLN